VKPAHFAIVLVWLTAFLAGRGAVAADGASPAGVDPDARFTIAVIPDTQNMLDDRHQKGAAR
jgi:riboflavin synthase alpha subunit